MINILHITDFHYKPERRFQHDQKSIVEKITENIKEEIDLIIFSGDLVFQGDSDEEFIKAGEILFDPLKAKLGLDSSHIILCAGNHDIDRSQAITAIFKYIDEKIVDNPSLDKYLSSRDYEHSINPLNNYLNFEKSFYKNSSSIVKSDPLFKVLKLKVKDKRRSREINISYSKV